MQKKITRLGISGGTFDPIHYGHLIIAEEIREKLRLDSVLFIPSGNPPHKVNINVTDAVSRFEMVRHAVSSNPFFNASRIETDRMGHTYTIDTLKELKKTYGDDTEFYFITGADVVRELTTWKDYEMVFMLCHFVAVLRPGYPASDFLMDIELLKSEYGVYIHEVEAPLIGISSTIIRDRVARGVSIRYLVPETVENYIYKKGLYLNKIKRG